jgi:hypothetical protein
MLDNGNTVNFVNRRAVSVHVIQVLVQITVCFRSLKQFKITVYCFAYGLIFDFMDVLITRCELFFDRHKYVTACLPICLRSDTIVILFMR